MNPRKAEKKTETMPRIRVMKLSEIFKVVPPWMKKRMFYQAYKKKKDGRKQNLNASTEAMKRRVLEMKRTSPS